MSEISAKTKLLCVVGSPVSHSLSPWVQNRLIRDAGLGGQYVYTALTVQSGDAELFAKSAKSFGFAGFNVTMPMKSEILPFLDEIDGEAQLYGAVNTVVNCGGVLHGYNTDGSGFLRSLALHGFCADVPALVLGAGGAARTVAMSLAKAGASVRVCSRTPPGFDMPGITAVPWNRIREYAADVKLLVNATPLGMHGVQADFEDFGFVDALPPDALVCDLIYAPRKTRLLEYASARGFKTMNGLPLLVCQAAEAFRHFTGVTAERESLLEILEQMEKM